MNKLILTDDYIATLEAQESLEALDNSYCLHEESENGICNECGSGVDWINRCFKENDND